MRAGTPESRDPKSLSPEPRKPKLFPVRVRLGNGRGHRDRGTGQGRGSNLTRRNRAAFCLTRGKMPRPGAAGQTIARRTGRASAGSGRSADRLASKTEIWHRLCDSCNWNRRMPLSESTQACPSETRAATAEKSGKRKRRRRTAANSRSGQLAAKGDDRLRSYVHLEARPQNAGGQTPAVRHPAVRKRCRSCCTAPHGKESAR